MLVHLRQWWVTLLVLSSILLLSFIPENLHTLLELRHQPIEQGQWWRLYSCHFVHLSFNHTLLNFAGYSIIAFSFRNEISPTRELLLLFISCTAVGLGIYYFNTEMYSYVGLSGAIYGVLLAFVIIGFLHTPIISAGFLGYMIIKFAYEAIMGSADPNTEAFIGGKVASDSHLYGALSGILPGLCLFLHDRNQQRYYDTERFVRQFSHPIVKDLAWVLHSPPLLKLNASEHRTITRKEWACIAHQFLPQLQALDKNPEQLIQAIEPDKFRLGLYFESLIAYWLRHQERYTLLQHGLKVQDGTRTVGEFDFIVRDNQTQTIHHWEAAVKFYLGTGDYKDAALWYGPGKKDRFDNKLSHLVDKQIHLADDRHGKTTLQANNLSIDERRLLIKGRLFYPEYAHRPAADLQQNLEPAHLKGRWYPLATILSARSAKTLGFDFWQRPRFHMAEKSEWFVLKTAPPMDLKELQTFLRMQPVTRPLMIIGASQENNIKRFFVVPDNWQSELQ